MFLFIQKTSLLGSLLPPASEVCGKVLSSVVCVDLCQQVGDPISHDALGPDPSPQTAAVKNHIRFVRDGRDF